MNDIERWLRRLVRGFPLGQQWRSYRARFLSYFRRLERSRRWLLSIVGLALGAGCLVTACLVCSLGVLMLGRTGGF